MPFSKLFLDDPENIQYNDIMKSGVFHRVGRDPRYNQRNQRYFRLGKRTLELDDPELEFGSAGFGELLPSKNSMVFENENTNGFDERIFDQGSGFDDSSTLKKLGWFNPNKVGANNGFWFNQNSRFGHSALMKRLTQSAADFLPYRFGKRTLELDDPELGFGPGFDEVSSSKNSMVLENENTNGFDDEKIFDQGSRFDDSSTLKKLGWFNPNRLGANGFWFNQNSRFGNSALMKKRTPSVADFLPYLQITPLEK